MGAADAMGAIGAVWMQPAAPRRPAPGAQAVRAAGGRAAPGHGPGLWRRMHQLCAAQPACQPPCASPDRRGRGRGGARGHCGGTLGGDGGGRAGRAQVGRGLCAPGPRLSGRAPGPNGRGQRHGLPAHAVPPGAGGGRSREGAGPGCHRRDAGARPQPRCRRAWRMPGLCDLHLGLHRTAQGRGHLPPLPGRAGAAGRRLCRAVAAGPRAAVRHAEFRWLHRAAVRAAGGRRGHGAARARTLGQRHLPQGTHGQADQRGRSDHRLLAAAGPGFRAPGPARVRAAQAGACGRRGHAGRRPEGLARCRAGPCEAAQCLWPDRGHRHGLPLRLHRPGGRRRRGAPGPSHRPAPGGPAHVGGGRPDAPRAPGRGRRAVHRRAPAVARLPEPGRAQRGALCRRPLRP
ncbi:MAG: hypothetical protein GAK34_02367 [Delftia tsuruhatensis]|nr:MAG: hypothetical protein GAK34_02367 [Delftia tsuruhatensis]